MTTISIATRCPDTKWISGILNLSLGGKPLLTVVSVEPFRDAGWGGGWAQGMFGVFPRALLGTGTAAMGEEAFFDYFY